MARLPRLFALIAIGVFLSACGVNEIPKLDEEVNAAWSQVENQYQRRADLIPNLVETVKGYAAQERETLTAVTEARAQATQLKIPADILTNRAALDRFEQLQSTMTSALSRLLAVSERYPELKSNQNFLSLQSQLEGTENRITIARRDYNQAVQAYNTRIRTFPDAVGAKIFYGAKPMVPFQATTPGADTAPTVNFGG